MFRFRGSARIAGITKGEASEILLHYGTAPVNARVEQATYDLRLTTNTKIPLIISTKTNTVRMNLKPHIPQRGKK